MSVMSILIKGGLVIDPLASICEVLDVYIKDGKVTQIGQNLDLSAEKVIDARDMCVSPGLVDMHTHLRDPGYEYKETIETGTISAALGGFTTIACMPNTNPVIDNSAVVRDIIERAKKEGVINVLPIGAITKGQKGSQLAEMMDMQRAGIVAVSDDGVPVSDGQIMKNALKYAATVGLPVISHSEDLSITGDGVMNQGKTATFLGLRGIPSAAESAAVARDILLAMGEKVPIHIAHVSTAESVAVVKQLRSMGANVTCETCPHYFSLDDSAVEGYNTNAKVNPPLRSKEDVKAIVNAIAEGVIDVIATDHAPHHIDEKRVEFDLAKSGMVGFETALSLAITYLVEPGVINLSQLVRLMSVRPAEILKIDKGTIKVGSVGDIIIWDMNSERKIDAGALSSKSKNTPFDGMSLKGRVLYTICGGKLVVEEGNLVKKGDE